jgi:hypothetical protein
LLSNGRDRRRDAIPARTASPPPHANPDVMPANAGIHGSRGASAEFVGVGEVERFVDDRRIVRRAASAQRR